MKNSDEDQMKVLMTVGETCASLGVSRSKLYDLVSRGQIKRVKLSHGPKAGVLFRPADLIDFAKRQAQKAKGGG